jgi:anti-sigma-K factor RskA
MTELTDPQPQHPPCHATRWLAATVACLLALAIGAATFVSMFEQFSAQIQHLQTQLKKSAQIKFVSVLVDDKGAPALLVTLDPKDGFVQIQRLNDVQEGREQSLQLWAMPASGKPRSLGVLAPKLKTGQLAVTEKMFADVTQLMLSVEIKGGIEADGTPRLPHLYTGAWIQKAI